MNLTTDDVEYFNKGRGENFRYWQRLGGKPSFKGAVVCEVGCGHGSLAVDIAASGAKKVIGLDLNARLIKFADENLKQNFPHLVDVVEFRCHALKDISETGVDYFVSKDAFEHINGLYDVLSEMRKRLKTGGRIYTGFGPLWNSPFGHHCTKQLPIPWGHVLFSEKFVINWLNRKRGGGPIKSFGDLGVNRMKFAEYMHVFHICGMNITYCDFNMSEKKISKIFSLIRKLALFEEYFTNNVYCILEKPKA
jgi:SAM-dependent methyltransferase